jgi:hypothetical protein
MNYAPGPTTLQTILTWLDWQKLTTLCVFALALLHPSVRDAAVRWLGGLGRKIGSLARVRKPAAVPKKKTARFLR